MTGDLDRALERLTGRPGVVFRDGQREAVEALAVKRERVLLVQRTGWGKSAVYFLATRLLRDAGLGPTLLISPLLALMRNQIEAAQRLGLRAHTINSASDTKVSEIADLLDHDEIDLLLISPERLANPEFGDKVMPLVGRRPGLIVIDEAHCISDWGHDFRPDYRRLGQLIDGLPGGFPVLGCTATANDRVVDDVASQLGVTMNVLRGPLTRSGLSLQVIDLPDAAERLCWLDRHLGDLPGSGIIYCLTVDDTRRVADWLSQRGHSVIAYSGDLENEHRLDAEAALQANEIKALVATTALGMGYDKPDLGFVVHFQAPGSPIGYYQQVGRAGRALEASVAVLLRGTEDSQIQDWFIQQAFPDQRHIDEVLAVFDDARGPVTLARVEEAVNMKHSTLELVLKQLTVEGALTRLRSQTYERTLRPWVYPTARVQAVTAARRVEQQQMREYATTASCRMCFLTGLLDDTSTGACGVCDVCVEPRFREPLDPAETAAARLFLRQGFITIEPRKRLVGRALPEEQRFDTGRALCVWGDRGWGTFVMAGKQEGVRFDDRLVAAIVDMVHQWSPDPMPTWIAHVPSLRHPGLVADLAQRIGAALHLPVVDVVRKVRDTPQQKGMQNSSHQHSNVDDAFAIDGVVPPGPVFLVDDLVDSRWTLTEIARRLRLAGSGRVFPLALASTMGERLLTVSESSLVGLLLTNRLVDIAAKPFSAGEYWALVAKVPELDALLGAGEEAVAELLGGDVVESQRVTTLLDATTAFAFERERLEEEGISLLSTFDPRFPPRLIDRLGSACPAFLAVAGPAEWLSGGGLGVVGSRDANPSALGVARSAAKVAVDAGVPVVSGLARGIDQESMAGAFDGGGAVVGIPAEGLRVAARSPEVRRRVHNGELCIASPYAPGMRFTAGNAMGRNKIIYGLADVTLVVCSDHGSGGTWEGAKESIRRRFGPVAVWSGEGQGPGNAELVKLGGASVIDLHEVFTVAHRPSDPQEQRSLF